MQNESMTFKPPNEFAGEEAKLAELKKSDNIEDQIVVILMESDLDKKDFTGLWYSFAAPKAKRIVEKFDVRHKGSSLPQREI